METLRKILELLYFVTGGPVLALFAFFALKQITVAKQASKTASLRDAYRLAAEQANSYATEIVPKLNELDQVLKENDVTFLDDANVIVSQYRVEVERAPGNVDVDKLVAIIPAFMQAINRLETFSLFFTSRVADERIAFSSVGTTFVSSVKPLLPLLVISANNGNHENHIKLFLLWNHRLETQKLEREKGSIEARLREMKPRELYPIGVSRRGNI
jgi:hypothetical protein